ncbi:MAG TPA: response regulator [Marinagarivorans sp.]
MVAFAAEYQTSEKIRLQKNTTATVVKLYQASLVQQLDNIDYAALTSTVAKIQQSLALSGHCLFNREGVLVMSGANECVRANLPFLVPISRGDDTVAGYLYIQPSSFGDTHDRSQVVLPAILLWAALVSVFILLFLHIRRTVFEPLLQLSSAVKRFSNTNDFHIRANSSAGGEVGFLARAFNRLLRDMRLKEHDLIKAKNKADEANALKGDFLASVSHEIRTPMNGIIGTTELLLESLDKQKHKSYASTILRSSESLLAIINDILDFSKIESGKLEVESIPFNIYAEIEDVADLMAMRANEKGVEIVLAISPYIPETVIGDPSRLRQILTNLVSNAIKFTNQGHIIIEVEPLGARSHREKSETLRFSVVDTGIGISEDAQQRIFERFTQAESSITRKYGGTGLGLAICKQLVELLGGEISVESVEGKGSVFSFTLELCIDTEQAETEACNNLENVSALVVDDNPYFLEYIKLALRYFGLKVACTSSEKEALLIIGDAESKGRPVNIVLIDENMPLINGCVLAEKMGVTFVHSAPPVILLSDISADAKQEQAYARFGIAAYIQKPIRLKQLTALIELTLSKRSQGRPGDILTVDQLRIPSNPRPHSIKLAGPNILVADESDVLYALVQALLSDAGCNVSRVSNGDELTQHCMNHRVDLLLIDVELSELNGLALAKSIAKVRSEACASHTPIIAMAAKESQADPIEVISAGIDVLIHKSSLKAQLLSKVAVLIPSFIINHKNDFVHFDNVHILLVEDNRVNAQITTEILEEFGCSVHVCDNGKLGFDVFRERRFDVVLMDCQMPVMDGFESTRLIRHFEKSLHRKSTPIIALTANAMKGDSERCFNAGMDDYLTKPVKREKLRTLLTRCINSEKISIKVPSEVSRNEPLVDDDELDRVITFSRRAGIDIEHYILDIERSLRLLKSQFRAQSPKIVYETAQVISPICEAFGFNRLKNDVLRFSQAALDLHIEKITRTDALTSLLDSCIKTVGETKDYLCSLNNEITPGLPHNFATKINDADLGEHERKKASATGAHRRADKPVDASHLATTKREITGKPQSNKKTLYSHPAETIKVFREQESSPTAAVDVPTFNRAKKIFKAKFSTVLAEYLEDTDQYIQAIKLGVSRIDYDLIRDNAHPLKSSSYTLGFCELGGIAKQIEYGAKSHVEIEKIEQDVAVLLKTLGDTKAYIGVGVSE